MAVKRRPDGVQLGRTDIVTRPVSTFVRPMQPALPPDAPARNDLYRLAQSLSGTSDALASYAKAYTRETARGQAEAGESEAIGLLLRTEQKELSRMLTTPGGVPKGINQRILELGHGEELAKTFVQDVRQRYHGQSTAGANQPSNAFDRNSGDLDAWFKQLTLEREGQLPQLPAVLHGWRRIMLAEQQRLYGEQNRYLQERTLQANLDAAHGAFYGIATNEIANGGRDPKAIHQKMQEALPRTQQLHLLTPKQANASLFSAARAIAEQGIPGNPQLGVDLVREMLLGERKGANGQVLAPLGGSAEYAHLTNQVIEAAQRKAGELQRTLHLETIVRFREEASNGRLNEEAAKTFFTDNPHVLGGGTQGHLETLLLQNRSAVDKAREAQTKIAEDLAKRARAEESEVELNEFLRGRGEAGTLQGIPERMQVLKPNGEPKELQRQALLDRARDNELARIDEWGRQTAAVEAEAPSGPTSGPTLQQRVFDRQYEFLNRNGLEHPGWKDTLSGAFAAATPAAVAAQQPPPLLSQAVQLYETLEARAPGMLERHLPSQAARDFYRTYRIGRAGLRMDERQAMVFATTATSDVGVDETKAPAFKKVEEALQSMQSIFPWAESITNAGDLRDEITRVSKSLVRAGMHPDAAVEQAGKDVRNQYTNINGFMVRTGDRAIESFGMALSNAGLQPKPFEDVVKRYLEAYAKDNPAAADMTIAEDDYGPIPIKTGRQLSIRPVPNATGAWSVIDAVQGIPVASGPNNMRQTIGLRDLLGFEQRSQREEQDKEAKRLAKAAAEAARPKKVTSGYKPPGPDAPDIVFGTIKAIEDLAKLRNEHSGYILGRKLRWPDTGRRPKPAAPQSGWPEE